MRANSCSPAWPNGFSRSRKSKSRGVVLAIGTYPTASGGVMQPNSVAKTHYLQDMTIYDGKTVLWANVKARMQAVYGKENLTRLVSDAKIGPGTATRIKDQATSVGIDVLEKIAKPLKVQPWELLNPALGSTAPDFVDQRFEALRKMYAAVKMEDRNAAISAAMIALAEFMPESNPPTPAPLPLALEEKASEAPPSARAARNTQ